MIMKLWFNPASPFARKVRVVARETGQADRIEEVAVAVSPVKPNAEVQRENPLGKIPALATEDAGTLYDSAVICEYLDSRGGGKLFPTSGAGRWSALRLQALCDGILDAAVLRRYEIAVRPATLQWGDWNEGQRVKVAGGVAALEHECAAWGETFGIGQITAACALGYLDFRYASEPWRESHPKLAMWFARVSGRPSLATTRPSA